MIRNKLNIPEGWKKNILGNISEIIMGQSPSSRSYNQESKGLPFIQGKSDFSDDMKKIIIRQWTTEPTKISEIGDILFTVRAPVGELSINTEKICIGRGISAIRVKDDYSKDYIYYSLSSIEENINKKAQGSTFTAINSDDVKKIELNIPSKPEQQKIAEILGAVDEDIEKTDEVIKQTEKLKRGLMKELLIKGIGHTKFKKTKLGEIMRLEYGFSLPDRKRIDGKVPVYGSNGIVGSHNKSEVVGPGIIIGRKGTIGSVIWSEDDFLPIDTTYYVEGLKDTDLKWLFYKLQSLNLKKLNTASGVPGLNRDEAYKQKILLPEIEAQNKIAEILSSVDEKILVNKELNDKLYKLKKGLMSDLLSGKVRII